ncbi:MAG: cupin domain-containing protein [Pseudomonadota bacterium]
MLRTLFSFAVFLAVACPGAGRSQVVTPAHSRAPDIFVQPSVGDARFVGENTRLSADDLMTGRRRFGPGGHTAWHVHPGGQLIMVEEGVGFVQRSGEPLRQLRAGESDFTPPNTPHWHGAAPQSGTTMAMIHFGGIGPFLETIPPEMYSKAWRTPLRPLYLAKDSKAWPIGSRPDSLNYIGESDVPAADGLEFARGRFEAGGHTWWHVHPAGQLILAEKGVTLVQLRDEAVKILEPGQSFFTPAGVAHWHGATSHEAAQSVVLNFGAAALWLEPVAASHYAVVGGSASKNPASGGNGK